LVYNTVLLDGDHSAFILGSSSSRRMAVWEVRCVT